MTNTNPYYPALSEIVTVDNLPEFLHFLQDGINAIFDHLHYKNLYVSKSAKGSGAFYSLDILSKRKLAWEIPGTGVSLVLNPDHAGDAISAFPVTLSWEWKIIPLTINQLQVFQKKIATGIDFL